MSPDDCRRAKKKRAKDGADKLPPPPSRMEGEGEGGEVDRRRSSTLSSSVGLGCGGDICRICHCESAPDLPLISPCLCCGSLRFVHQQCLQQWIKSSDARCCELCKFQFVMRTTLKPFNKWEKLEMSSVERRKVVCSVAFHAVAVTCVVWSLYVLIERTAEEVRSGALEWPFWTKLVVVGVGFTGGLVFMYVQCKMYVHLFRRWRAYNRIIQVQDAPHKTNQQLTSSASSHGQAVFSAAAQMTASVLSEDVKRGLSPDEDEFHSCESSVANEDEDEEGGRGASKEGESSNLATADSGSTKTTLTSVADSTVHPLGEVVVVPPGGEDVS